MPRGPAGAPLVAQSSAAGALAVAIDSGERGAFQCLFVGFKQ